MTGRAARPGPRTRRTLLATAALAATLGLAAPATAAGPVLVSEGDLDISAQRTVVSWADGQQRMLLEYDLQGRSDATEPAIVLIATPTRPLMAIADPDLMQAFVDAGSPEVIEEEEWWPDLQSFGGGDDTPFWLRPDTALAPVGDGARPHDPNSAAAIIGYYQNQGFEIGEETASALERYVGAGWTISEISLDPAPESLDARSTPVVEMRFASPEPIAPVLLTAGGALPVDLSTYVIGTERLDRTSTPSSATVRFSGPVDVATSPLLADWLEPYGGTAVMTVVDQTISNPSQLSDDVTFGPSIYGAVDAGTEVVRVERIILGIPAGIMLVAGGMLVVAAAGVTISRLMQRGYRD
ncbi:DUF2330 domain-containing protein [Litorihabitans aurantiacus]|nr:DUF2330 domain-containing protein [Litorihabitans aurantiacus]